MVLAAPSVYEGFVLYKSWENDEGENREQTITMIAYGTWKLQVTCMHEV